MKYRSGYKYQLAENEFYDISKICEVDKVCSQDIVTEFIDLTPAGILMVKAGYAWDGPSGWFTIDTKSSMRASLFHDAWYQLIRQKLLAPDSRAAADDMIYQICIEDKMWRWRAWIWRRQLNNFAGFAADPKNAKIIHQAP